jgi:NAD(P)-dependent dehydrogenase (short-subunit alcohol dehydrogenase family)
VAVVDRDEGPGRETVDAIVAAGGQAAYIAADVTADADCAHVLESVRAAFGRLDVLVNNVGIIGRGMAEEEQWDLLMDVNAKSAFLMAKNAVPAMSAGGAIVNISSCAAFRPGRGPSAYPASKAAMIGLTASLAVRHGERGIRVNCVCPGPIHTPMAMRAVLGANSDPVAEAQTRELRRAESLLGIEGTAWDIANAVLFLVGDDSRYITGQTLVVDGGAGLHSARS